MQLLGISVKKLRLRLRISLSVVAICILATPIWRSSAAIAQEMQFLDLRGPGTAIIAFDESAKTAYIIDGGKAGNRGIAGADIDGHSILDALLQRGIERLVVVCSHPHSDHIDGLLDLVRDPTIANPQLREVIFADSDAPVESRLFEEYQKHWPEGRIPGRVATYRSARGVDALSPLAVANSEVVAHNFEYEPPEGEGHPHGRCVITLLELRKDGRITRVVDFDDANDVLLKKWAEWARVAPGSRRPDVIALPHHGSAHSDISPLLHESIRPRSAVICVNPDNQYRHPGPRNLLDLVHVLGAENVHFTGRSANIRIDERGIVRRADTARLRLDYELFLKSAALEIEREILEEEGRSQPFADEAKLGRLRETRTVYSELKHIMAPDSQDEAAPHAPIAKWRQRKSVLSTISGMPTIPDPDTPLDPFLAERETVATEHFKLESELSRHIKAVRDSLARKDFPEAARLGAEGLKMKGWSVREYQSLSRLAAAEPLLTDREVETGQRGPGNVGFPDAILWPEIAGREGSDALRRYAYREARDILESRQSTAAVRIRWVIEALERTGETWNLPGRDLLQELRYRVLLEGRVDADDIRAVASISPVQAAAQLRSFKAALAGQPVPDGLGRSNPLLRDLPAHAVAEVATRQSTAELIRGIGARQSGIEVKAGTGNLASGRTLGAKVLLSEIDAVVSLRDREVSLRNRLIDEAVQVLKEPLLACERLSLRERVSAGTPLTAAIDELRTARKRFFELAGTFNQKGEAINWKDAPSLTLRDIGLTPEVIARRQADAMMPGGLGRLKSGEIGEIGQPMDLTKLKESIRKAQDSIREFDNFRKIEASRFERARPRAIP